MNNHNTFDLHFKAKEEQFAVAVYRNGEKVTTHKISFPLSPVTVTVDLANIEPGKPRETRELIQKVGAQLSKAIFSGTVLKSFQTAQKNQKPLIIRLRFHSSAS